MSPKKLIARRIGRRNTRNQERDIQKAAPVERKVAHLALRDGACNLAACRLDRSGFTGHGNRGIATRHDQRERQFEGRARTQLQRANRVGKSGVADGDFVRSHAQIGKAEPALLVRQELTVLIRFHLARTHLRSSYHTTGGIGYPSAYAGVMNTLLCGHNMSCSRDEGKNDKFHDTPPTLKMRTPRRKTGRRLPYEGWRALEEVVRRNPGITIGPASRLNVEREGRRRPQLNGTNYAERYAAGRHRGMAARAIHASRGGDSWTLRMGLVGFAATGVCAAGGTARLVPSKRRNSEGSE